jgi:hypothetical protein
MSDVMLNGKTGTNVTPTTLILCDCTSDNFTLQPWRLKSSPLMTQSVWLKFDEFHQNFDSRTTSSSDGENISAHSSNLQLKVALGPHIDVHCPLDPPHPPNDVESRVRLGFQPDSVFIFH